MKHILLLCRALLGMALFAGLSQHISAQGLDESELNITLREDPVYPVPEIGQRRFYCRYVPGFQQNDPRMVLRFARQASFLENTDAGAPYVTEVPPAAMFQNQVTGSYYQAIYTMPWRKRDPGSNNLTGPEELLPDGHSGFYQWVLEYVSGGSTKRSFGDVHSFTMPRRLVFGIMGDSFGSGEGAPATGSNPWINTAAHRSRHSGGEIAISLFRNTYHNLAFDYFNTSSSGAIAHDIWSNTSQSKREGSDGQGLGTPQAKLVEGFLGKPESSHDYNRYKHVDAIIFSCGGNDFGFSTILEHYFGVPRIGILGAAIACSPLLILVNGPVLYVGCIAAALFKDYSFEMGNEAPFVSEGKWRYFPFFRDRLRNEYVKMENRLVNNLRVGTDPTIDTKAQVHHFLVTEYPNPLKTCKRHWDFEEKLGFLPIPLLISEDETTEAKTKLAVQTYNTPAPSSGGLNHALRGIVENTNNLSTADWQFVQTGHLIAANGGVCHGGRQFNERYESYDMAGPNPANNAIHPNRKGHNGIYAPAISAALQATISPSYRQNRAFHEGIKPGTTLLADLVIYSLTMTNFNQSTREISFRAIVRNFGNVASDPGELSIYARSVDDFSFLVKLGEVPVPTVQPLSAAPQPLEFTLTIPDHPAFRKVPIGCYKAGASFNPAAYATRDLALAHWFIQNSFLEGQISTPSTEKNIQNNTRNAVDATNAAINTWKIGPPITPAQLDVVLQNFATHRGLATATPADIRLDHNYDLAFFGFCDPVQKYIEENGSIIPVTDLIDLVDGVSSDQNPFTNYGNPSLRNFCTGNQGGFITSHLGSLVEGGIQSIADIGINSGNDGRPTAISLEYPGIGGQAVSRDLQYATPSTAVGLPNYPPGEPITGQSMSFNFSIPAKVVGYRFMAGLNPSRADFYDSGMVLTRSAGAAPPASALVNVRGFPADGRAWFLTIESLMEDGKTLINGYKFESEARNARLLSPDEGALPSGFESAVQWQAGTLPADGYRVRVGSKPGGWDIFGSDPAVGDGGMVSPSTTAMSIPALPRDGRKIFITLETLRGGVWHSESYRSEVPMSEEPSLIFPDPGSALGGRAVIRLRPADEESREILLTAGTSPGASDLFAGEPRDPSREELVWDFTLPTPSSRETFIYITAQSDRDPQRRTYWVFPRSKNSTLLTPSPDPFTAVSPGEVPFSWLAGTDVAGHMLSVGTTPGGNDITEWLGNAQALSTTVRIPETAVGRLIFVSLHTIRTVGSNGVEPYILPVNVSNRSYENDGIDDYIQAHYFGANNPMGTADADFNGNGDSNLIDMLAGIDPRVSGLRWDRRGEITPGGMLRFPLPATLPGTLYQIERSSDLRYWENHGAPMQFDSATPDGVIEGTRRTGMNAEFYRLKLEPRK